MSTKINTLKQLRGGANETFLGNKEGELKWLTLADLEAVSTPELEAVKQELLEKLAEINTAKFVGPFATIEAATGEIDDNDLVLVGTEAPFKIFARVGEEFVELGKTDVSFEGYATEEQLEALRAELDEALDGIQGQIEDIKGDIQAEVDRAKEAEATEKARAEAKEAEIENAIATEKARAEEAEAKALADAKAYTDEKIAELPEPKEFKMLIAEGESKTTSVTLNEYVEGAKPFDKKVFLNGVRLSPVTDYTLTIRGAVANVSLKDYTLDGEDVLRVELTQVVEA